MSLLRSSKGPGTVIFQAHWLDRNILTKESSGGMNDHDKCFQLTVMKTWESAHRFTNLRRLRATHSSSDDIVVVTVNSRMMLQGCTEILNQSTEEFTRSQFFTPAAERPDKPELPYSFPMSLTKLCLGWWVGPCLSPSDVNRLIKPLQVSLLISQLNGGRVP